MAGFPRASTYRRVAVNRIGNSFLGSDWSKRPRISSSGRVASYQTLLDTLAIYDSEWDVKQLVKDIVMSQTYRQSSDASHEADTIRKIGFWLEVLDIDWTLKLFVTKSWPLVGF